MAKSIFRVTPWGTSVLVAEITDDMTSPVLCTFCGKVYDLGKVEVTGRYNDCSVFTTPCCAKKGVDDRMHVSLPAFKRLTKTDHGLVME